MRTQKTYVALAFSALLINEAWAGGKTIKGLSFQLSPSPKQQCLYQPFHVRQEPDAFFKGLKQVRSKGKSEYRKGHDIVTNYPDLITVRVELSQSLTEFNSCGALPRFDPANLRFLVEWHNNSKLMPAGGKFLVSKMLPPTWSEDRCGEYCAYELRIDAQDVALQSDLVITIETLDGALLAKYVGKVSTDDFQPYQYPYQYPLDSALLDDQTGKLALHPTTLKMPEAERTKNLSNLVAVR
jgi:hypothetical protein